MTNGGDVQTCAQHMPAEIFDLVSQNYTGIFNADGAKRPAPVPSQVVSVIGGSPSGGAYVTQPKVWSDLYLQYVFNPSLTRPSYTPSYVLANATSDNATAPAAVTDNGMSNSAIIGGTVGGAVGVLLLITIAIIIFIFRRNKARRNRKSAHSELPAPLPPYNMAKHDHAPEHTVLPLMQTEPAELAVPHRLSEFSGQPPTTPSLTSQGSPEYLHRSISPQSAVEYDQGSHQHVRLSDNSPANTNSQPYQ
jgi:hypothetical protein